MDDAWCSKDGINSRVPLRNRRMIQSPWIIILVQPRLPETHREVTSVISKCAGDTMVPSGILQHEDAPLGRFTGTSPSQKMEVDFLATSSNKLNGRFFRLWQLLTQLSKWQRDVGKIWQSVWALVWTTKTSRQLTSGKRTRSYGWYWLVVSIPKHDHMTISCQLISFQF